MSLEYSCVYHDKGLCSKFSEPGYVSYCVFGPCSHQIPSNADRIRAMSDEELANYLSVKFADLQIQNVFTKDSPPTATQISMLNHMWYDAWMQWLQQPVKEDS